MPVTSLNTYSDVNASKFPWWRLEITNWGNRQTGADATSLVYPANGNQQAGPNIPGGAQAIAIGPDSTADAFIVDYNQILTPGVFTVPDPGVLNQQSLTVSVGRPVYQVPGSMIYRTAFSTQFSDTYIKDGVTGTANLGTNPVFESPTLQVLTYLQPPIFPLPVKRVDMYRSVNTIIAAAGGAEQTLAIWPVMGRRWMGVYLRASGSLVAAVRVGRIVDYVATTAGPTVAARPVERTVGSGNINAGTAAQLCISTGKPCQWLALYTTYTSGVGGVVATMIATDDAGETDLPSSP